MKQEIARLKKSSNGCEGSLPKSPFWTLFKKEIIK